MRVIILRGASGSGKSTLAKEFVRLEPRSVICSADDHFMSKDGEYEFDRRFLNEAHLSCLRKFRRTLESPPTADIGLLIVDNTNTRAYEIAPYYQLAAMEKLPVRILTIIADPELCWTSNQHSVPVNTILYQCNRIMGEELPSWWKKDVAFRRCEPVEADVDGNLHYEELLSLNPAEYLENLR